MNTYYVTFYNTNTAAWWESEYYTNSQEVAQALAESQCTDNVVISDICSASNQKAFESFYANS